MKKTRCRKPKAANADPNHTDQEHRGNVPLLPSMPQTSNVYNSDLYYFVTIQNHHFMRLQNLFPEIYPAVLKRILESFAGDFIRAVDHILCSRRNYSIYGSHGNNPSSVGFCRNRRDVSHPYMYKHVSSNNNDMTMMEPPFMTPMYQTSHKMPAINQVTPSNYHIYQNPGMNNNSMPMQTHAFMQGSNMATPNQFFQNSNKFPEPVPFPAVPNHRPNVLPVQTTSTCQPFTEGLKRRLRPPFLYSDMPQPHSYEINDNASSVHGQYLMQPSQMVRPNLAPTIKQEPEWSHLAPCNSGERPSKSTNQVTHKTMTEMYAKQQNESWLQQQQHQGYENQIMDFLNNVQPLIPHLAYQDVGEPSVPLLPSSHDRETAPIIAVSTAADVQCQRGKFEDNQFKSPAANGGEVATDAESTQKLVAEELQMLRVTSNTNLNKFAAEGSVPLQEKGNSPSSGFYMPVFQNTSS